MKNFILNNSRLLIVVVLASIGFSSCVVHETSHHRGRRPVVIVQESHPKHYKQNNKYKDKHHKPKKHDKHRKHDRRD